ncbi:hypothetical protein FHS43_005930 [Streptosporangium becharense]|uniref:Uncharacterized protein n=1 Tax=Streptosporangium becharense TaxID=1816182 RepID=A0A7W9INN9_9ACTN|nr:hypothetical protein [Streptosporangium becharense]MBB2914618.1 hypothetical protein [Streptosporangium becharense]MBB5823463.1 hypothetical protein [Streptosporangium becharense]
MTRRFDDVARSVAGEVAPEEAAFYPVIAAAVRRDPGRILRPACDDPPGAGVAGTAALVTPIVITVLSDVVAGLLAETAGGHARRRSGRLWHRPENGIADPSTEVPVLEPALADRAGRAAEQAALDMRIGPGAALRLRQAMHRHLSGRR